VTEDAEGCGADQF